MDRAAPRVTPGDEKARGRSLRARAPAFCRLGVFAGRRAALAARFPPKRSPLQENRPSRVPQVKFVPAHAECLRHSSPVTEAAFPTIQGVVRPSWLLGRAGPDGRAPEARLEG